MAALLALISALVWGVADFMGGLASRRSTPLQALFVTTPIGLLVIVPLAMVFGGDSAGSALPGTVAGAFGALGILLLYEALTIGPMGVLSPISAVLGAAIPVIVGLARGDRPSAWAFLGMALAVVAIVTVGLEPKAHHSDDSAHQRVTPRALGFALAAGVCIGFFFAIIALAPKDAGLWPVVFARSTSTIMLVPLGIIVAIRTKTAILPPSWQVRRQAAAAGVLDVAANAFYILASQVGLLSVVAVLGSLYPAATVLLARMLLGERLRPVQKFGMATAIVATVLLALG
ncbi:MAG: EamA family transporter [Actinomycetes bacterium]